MKNLKESIETKYSKPQRLLQVNMFFNALKYDMFLIVFENNCCLMEEDDARFTPFFNKKQKGNMLFESKWNVSKMIEYW